MYGGEEGVVGDGDEMGGRWQRETGKRTQDGPTVTQLFREATDAGHERDRVEIDLGRGGWGEGKGKMVGRTFYEDGTDGGGGGGAEEPDPLTSSSESESDSEDEGGSDTRRRSKTSSREGTLGCLSFKMLAKPNRR